MRNEENLREILSMKEGIKVHPFSVLIVRKYNNNRIL